MDSARVKEYQCSYLRDVLRLEEGAKEEDIEDRLIAEAKELGVSVQAKKQSIVKHSHDDRPASMRTMEATPRRSSVDSKFSVATSMISTTSTPPARAGLSFRDYDSFLSRGRPEGRTSMSFLPPTTPSASASASVFSLALSSPEASPKKHYRLMRGLSMLKLNRADSPSLQRGCPHCPRDATSQRRAVHKLPCGHRLCTKGLRQTIIAASSGEHGSIPSCCGTPLPGCLVEHVMTQQEQTTMLDKLDHWKRAASAAPSVSSETTESVTLQRPGALLMTGRTVSDESKVDSVASKSKQLLSAADDSQPKLQNLRKEQARTQTRFDRWAETRRAELAQDHERCRQALRKAQEATVERLEETHAQSMSEAEDKQVKAEADLRAIQAKEARDNATALKHMEAYCAGTYVSTGEPHFRRITAADVAELENARKAKEAMPGKHGSAINVLRGEQSRRLKLRAQRQEREVLELRRGQRMEELEKERGWSEEVKVLEEFVGQRLSALRARWELEGRVLAEKLRLRGGHDAAEDGSKHATDQCEDELPDHAIPGAIQAHCEST